MCRKEKLEKDMSQWKGHHFEGDGHWDCNECIEKIQKDYEADDSLTGKALDCESRGYRFESCSRYQIMTRKEARIQKALGLAKTCSRCGKIKLLKDFSKIDLKCDPSLELADACCSCCAIKRQLDTKQLQQVLNKMRKERKKCER